MELVAPINNGSYYEGRKKKLKFDANLLFYVLFLLWPVAQFCIFYIYVNFNSLLLIFKGWDNDAAAFVWTGLNNSFGALFTSIKNTPKLYLNAVFHSFASWAIGIAFGTFFASLFSFYIFRKRFGGKFFKFVLFLPSVIPSILLSGIFTYLCNDAIKILIYNMTGAKTASLVDPANPAFYWLIVVFNVITGFGSQVLLYSGGMSQINPSLIEAARLDGASPFKTFIHVAVPQIMPTIGTFLVAGVALFFTNQANLWNFAQARLGTAIEYQNQMNIGYYMFWLVSGQSSLAGNYANYPMASALGIIATAIAIPLTMLVRKFVKKFER